MTCLIFLDRFVRPITAVADALREHLRGLEAVPFLSHSFLYSMDLFMDTI